MSTREFSAAHNKPTDTEWRVKITLSLVDNNPSRSNIKKGLV